MKTKNSEALVSLQDNLFSWRPAICITHPRRRTEQVPQVTIPKNYRWGREKKGEQNGITLCVIEGKKAQRSVQFWGKNRAGTLAGPGVPGNSGYCGKCRRYRLLATQNTLWISRSRRVSSGKRATISSVRRSPPALRLEGISFHSSIS